MVITGSAFFIQPGTAEAVLERLKAFPDVTFQARSDSGTELVVNLEAEDHLALEQLCRKLMESIPELVEIGHLYVNFEEEVEKMIARRPGHTSCPTEPSGQD